MRYEAIPFADVNPETGVEPTNREYLKKYGHRALGAEIDPPVENDANWATLKDPETGIKLTFHYPEQADCYFIEVNSQLNQVMDYQWLTAPTDSMKKTSAVNPPYTWHLFGGTGKKVVTPRVIERYATGERLDACRRLFKQMDKHVEVRRQKRLAERKAAAEAAKFAKATV